MGAFDGVKLYPISCWTVVKEREFTENELKSIKEAKVIPSKFGMSVCFMFVNGNRYIPLEPVAAVNLGDRLKPENLKLIELEYTGTDPNQIKKKALKVRVCATADNVVVEPTFEDPFNLG